MADTTYYEILQVGLPGDLTVSRLIHGISWTAAVLSDGSTGVAMHTTGETVPRMFKSLVGLPLTEAGKAVLSWNMEEASEALAAVNAFYNHPGCGFETTWDTKPLDGFDLKGRTIGMVGKMIGRGITQEILAPVKKLYVMDREEKPGALPDSASEFYLPLCDMVIITGSAAINKTLPRLLELSRNAEIILLGASVSCCPELLQLGIRRLCGSVVTEKEAMLKAIVEKRTSVNDYSLPYVVEGNRA